MDKQAILNEIIQFNQVSQEPELLEGDLTYEDIEAALGCAHAKAQKVMRGLIAAGKFERLDVPCRGGRLAVFRKIV